MSKKKFAIVGAGFTGSVLANELAKAGHEVHIFEERDHIGGNCYTNRDQTGILVHIYGPHIFHTNNIRVWNYITNLAEIIPYTNRVKTQFNGEVFSLPINLHTINQFFRKNLNPNDARSFIENLSDKSIINPTSFEDQALAFVGKDLYEAFFKFYTLKQWGISPSKLPASILQRLPIRFNYDDNYFNHQFQGIPKDGYTPIFEKLIDHKNIEIHLQQKFDRSFTAGFEHVFYSGPIDSWFDFDYGCLAYRTLDFKKEVHIGDFQGCAVMNYPSLNFPYTRITEHKHFAPYESHSNTVIYKEFSRDYEIGDIPYYPIRLVKDKEILRSYIEKAKTQKKVSFMGRLGTYRYLDMDNTIHEALSACDLILENLSVKKELPVFFNQPI
jgi:UDP-galactopyranose mutase